MHATIRRYDGTDEARTDELIKKAEETLVPRLRELPGFGGYQLVDAGQGVVVSVTTFETSEQAEESNRTARAWVRDEGLEAAIPNAPQVTAGEVVVHSPREVASA